MKKTLLGVLAFVLILATVLTCTVFAADDPSAEPQKVADIKKVTGSSIKVDGYMDKAYEGATALEMSTYQLSAKNIYTHAYIRFLWSADESAFYCFIIVNDIDVGEAWYDEACKTTFPWSADSLELFVVFGDGKTKAEWGIPGGLEMSRGRQYRIDGFTGEPTCYLAEDGKVFMDNNPDWTHAASGKKAHDAYATYRFDDDTKTFKNEYDSALTSDGRNAFGWGYSDDLTKQGWGHQVTDYGYTLEFRIEEADLRAGQQVYFDVQANDKYMDIRGQTTPLHYFYNSAARLAGGDPESMGSVKFYDWVVLSDEEVVSDGEYFSLDQLEQFGMGDARTSKSKPKTERPINKTEKKTWTMKATSAITTPTTDPDISNDPEGGNDDKPSDPTGGCGSTITVGASVAAVALVGAAGFFAFRKKDDE